jgi:glycosyltransferase involved in cell wall biosynthesis
MTDDMQAYARQYLGSGTVCFAGFVPSAQTVPYYLASDLVICTSRYETWARMVNEAMLCRRPCVVNRVVPAAGGLVEHGENGYVVEAPEAAPYVPVIDGHFSLPANARGRMGDAARARAQAFAYEPYINNVLASARHALAHARRIPVARTAD